jgi:hypothetical protein
VGGYKPRLYGIEEILAMTKRRRVYSGRRVEKSRVALFV